MGDGLAVQIFELPLSCTARKIFRSSADWRRVGIFADQPRLVVRAGQPVLVKARYLPALSFIVDNKAVTGIFFRAQAGDATDVCRNITVIINQPFCRSIIYLE